MPLLDSLRKGLSTCGLLQKMEAHPSLFEPVFSVPKEPLTIATFFKHFQDRQVGKGGNQKFKIENKVLQHFMDFLTECEGEYTV